MDDKTDEARSLRETPEVQRLIQDGREDGFVILGELIDALPERAFSSPEDVRDLIRWIDSQGMEIRPTESGSPISLDSAIRSTRTLEDDGSNWQSDDGGSWGSASADDDVSSEEPGCIFDTVDSLNDEEDRRDPDWDAGGAETSTWDDGDATLTRIPGLSSEETRRTMDAIDEGWSQCVDAIASSDEAVAEVLAIGSLVSNGTIPSEDVFHGGCVQGGCEDQVARSRLALLGDLAKAHCRLLVLSGEADHSSQRRAAALLGAMKDTRAILDRLGLTEGAMDAVARFLMGRDAGNAGGSEGVGRRILTSLRRLAQARECLVQCQQGLVHSTAIRLLGKGMDRDDLVQEGNLALAKALRPPLERRGSVDGMLAAAIRRGMEDALARQRAPVALSDKELELARRLDSVQEQFLKNHGRQPTDQEAAEKLEITPERLRLLLLALDAVSPSSPAPSQGSASNSISTAEAPSFPGDDGSTADRDGASEEPAAEVSSSPDAVLQSQSLSDCIAEAMSFLTPKEKRILMLRFGLPSREQNEASDDGSPMTLEEIGRIEEVTRERIRQIEECALRKLRKKTVSRKLRDFIEMDGAEAAGPSDRVTDGGGDAVGS